LAKKLVKPKKKSLVKPRRLQHVKNRMLRTEEKRSRIRLQESPSSRKIVRQKQRRKPKMLLQPN